MKNEEFVDVFIFRQKEQKKHIFQILLFSEFHHKLQLTFAGKEIPTLPQRITSKGTKKRTKLRSDFAPKGIPKAKNGSENKEAQTKLSPPTAISPKAKSDSPPKIPSSVSDRKAEKQSTAKRSAGCLRKRVPALPTSEASQPVRNCRRRFFFLLPFSFCRQKEKVRASQKKK